MRVAICHTKSTSVSTMTALDKGIRRCGDIVYHIRGMGDIHDIERSDVLICICYPSNAQSFRVACHNIAKEQKKRIIYVDSGCMRFSKFKPGSHNYYQVGFDCIKNYGKYYNQNSPPDRFLQLELPIIDWKPANISKVALIGQNPRGVTSQNFNVEQWFKKTIIPYIKHEYVYINHPNTKAGQGRGAEQVMKKQLKEARACVAWCSNALVEFIRNGVATIVGCSGGLAYEYTQHDVSSLSHKNYNYFDREQLLYDLAYTQWTEQEMTEGLTWDHLKPHAMKIEDVNYSLSFF